MKIESKYFYCCHAGMPVLNGEIQELDFSFWYEQAPVMSQQYISFSCSMDFIVFHRLIQSFLIQLFFSFFQKSKFLLYAHIYIMLGIPMWQI